jgi:hypothetical protein
MNGSGLSHPALWQKPEREMNLKINLLRAQHRRERIYADPLSPVLRLAAQLLFGFEVIGLGGFRRTAALLPQHIR